MTLEKIVAKAEKNIYGKILPDKAKTHEKVF